MKAKNVKSEAKKLTVQQTIRREMFAWFWVGLVFLLQAVPKDR